MVFELVGGRFAVYAMSALSEKVRSAAKASSKMMRVWCIRSLCGFGGGLFEKMLFCFFIIISFMRSVDWIPDRVLCWLMICDWRWGGCSIRGGSQWD